MKKNSLYTHIYSIILIFSLHSSAHAEVVNTTAVFESKNLTTQAQSSPGEKCTQEDAMQAQSEASSLKDWDAVYLSFKKYSYCNKENIIEPWGAYSDTVVRLLVREWKHFDRLVVLTSTDPEFEQLIINHASDETVPSDQLKNIIKNTRMHCSSNGKKLCEKIMDAAS